MFKAFQLVIGCGQCGEMFSTTFENVMGYYSIALNFNKDTDRMDDHTKIIDKGGTGRKKELGRHWYQENAKDLEDFVISHINKIETTQKIKNRNRQKTI